jgi:hypothetical protein
MSHCEEKIGRMFHIEEEIGGMSHVEEKMNGMSHIDMGCPTLLLLAELRARAVFFPKVDDFDRFYHLAPYGLNSYPFRLEVR